MKLLKIQCDQNLAQLALPDSLSVEDSGSELGGVSEMTRRPTFFQPVDPALEEDAKALRHGVLEPAEEFFLSHRPGFGSQHFLSPLT